MLLICWALGFLGLANWRRARRKTREREEAERTLDRERRTLETRIEERTRELRQQVEERRRAEVMNRGQKLVLEMLATNPEAKVSAMLTHLTAAVADQRQSWACAIHLVAQNDRSLKLAAASEVDEKLYQHLTTIVADFHDAPESRACSQRKPVVLEKLLDLRRPWAELLVANGINSAWSVPFFAPKSSLITGVLTVYSRLQGSPEPRELELLQSAARLAEVVIEHRRIHAELVDQAYRDALTGLLNRRAGEMAIEKAAEQARKRDESVALLWVDLNRFKRINDQHGHAAGDLVLRTVAERLKHHPLAAGGVARMGGDEFLVVAPRWIASMDPTAIAEALGAVIAMPIAIGTAKVIVTASIGTCLYPEDGTAIDTLERNADFAMYRAKTSGASACGYTPAFSDEEVATMEIEQALAVAVEKDLLHLVYQPIYSRQGELAGFEALLRVDHPLLAALSPASYIPVAEETRMIVPIGNIVLLKACRQLKAWHQAGGQPVHVAVNISALQFAREDFAETVAGILKESQLDAQHLVLELTESVVMENYRDVQKQMNLLRQLGVRISMDDFGTGYSSLSYLHQLPIDILKIDRSFIERLDAKDGTRPIVEAILAMSRHLGLKVVAEGVETVQQQNILVQAGCDALQGFLFAPPLKVRDAENVVMDSGKNVCVADSPCSTPEEHRQPQAEASHRPAPLQCL
jgi:diguanylate cyclase (GGDEF)-like protein